MRSLSGETDGPAGAQNLAEPQKIRVNQSRFSALSNEILLTTEAVGSGS